jgi:NhaP-type Na+/H+ and K+/H+ antiporter
LVESLIVSANDSSLKRKLKLTANVIFLIIALYVLYLVVQGLFLSFDTYNFLYSIAHFLLIVMLGITFYQNIKFINENKHT